MAMNVILQKKKTLTESACLLKQGYIRLSYTQACKETSLDFLHNHIAFAQFQTRHTRSIYNLINTNAKLHSTYTTMD